MGKDKRGVLRGKCAECDGSEEFDTIIDPCNMWQLTEPMGTLRNCHKRRSKEKWGSLEKPYNLKAKINWIDRSLHQRRKIRK